MGLVSNVLIAYKTDSDRWDYKIITEIIQNIQILFSMLLWNGCCYYEKPW